MTLGWLGIAFATVLWPVPSRAERRLRGLAGAARLVAPADRGRRVWTLPIVSGRVAAGAGALVGVLLAGAVPPLLAAAAGVAVATATHLAAGVLRRRRWAAEDAALAEALGLIVAELAAGTSASAALAAAAELPGPQAARFAAGARAAEQGDDLAAVFADPAPRGVGSPASTAAWRAIDHAWRAAGSTGAPLRTVLARVEDDLGYRRIQHRAVSSALAGPRSSAAMLASLPVLGLALGTAMGARPWAILLGTTSGQLLLCTGVLLQAGGVLWTARLTESAARP